jgi:hypothetical protein
VQRSRGERKASVGPLPGPSPQVGDTIQLAIDGQRHALDVTALRGTPGERCGLPGTMLDVGAALRSLDAKPWACGVCTLINPPGRASCSACSTRRPEDAAAGGGGGGGVPVRSACLVDVDLEVDLAPSAEAEGVAEREAEAEAEARRRQQAEAEACAAAEAAAEAAAAREKAEAEAEAEARRRVASDALGALLGSRGGEEAALQCAVRRPDGTRGTARLRPEEPLLALWWLAEAEAPAGEALPPGFRLATGFPRRLLERPADGGVSLSSLGLDPGQHLFFVEA